MSLVCCVLAVSLHPLCPAKPCLCLGDCRVVSGFRNQGQHIHLRTYIIQQLPSVLAMKMHIRAKVTNSALHFKHVSLTTPRRQMPSPVHVEVAYRVCSHDWRFELPIASQKPWCVLFHKCFIVIICPELELPVLVIGDPTLPPSSILLWNSVVDPGLMKNVRDVCQVQQWGCVIQSINGTDYCRRPS